MNQITDSEFDNLYDQDLLEEADHSDKIAIVGIVSRYPGINNQEEFWNILKEGVETIRQERCDSATDPHFQPIKGYIDDVDLFDAPFFEFSKKEAELTDPQHRLFLEGAWELLEKAGYDPFSYEGVIGIYAGDGFCSYLLNNLSNHKDLIATVGELQTRITNDKNYLTAQVAYRFNLLGPCITVQASCATSLVAVHLACESLLVGRADMIIAGGVNITVPKMDGYYHQPDGLLSRDGHVRAFDAQATGTIYSEGMGIVLLKRLEDAIEDGDNVYAVIRGSATNSDGSVRMGFATPGVDGKISVIAEAMNVAQVEPEDISYIETQGSGTPMGDAIEIQAMKTVFGSKTSKTGFCGIGSVKTNIGHAQEASGVAALIKTTLALHHKTLPPSLNYHEPLPQANLPDSPFYVVSKLKEWPDQEEKKIAGVSSFGIGGVNAHLILEEAPPRRTSSSGLDHDVLLLSAKSSASLEFHTENITRFINDRIAGEIADVAYTLKVGRKKQPYRRALLIHKNAKMPESNSPGDGSKHYTLENDAIETPVVFVFANRCQLSMTQIDSLYQSVKEFQQIFDELSAVCKSIINFDAVKALSSFSESDLIVEEHNCLSFIAQSSLAKLWMKWGVIPHELYGLGTGEVVCTFIAGVLELEECISLLQTASVFDVAMHAREAAIPYFAASANDWIETDTTSGIQSMNPKDQGTESDLTNMLRKLDSNTAVFPLGSLSWQPDGNRFQSIFPLITPQKDQSAILFLQKQIAYLWLAGSKINWPAFYEHECRNRIELPTYPFERQRYWIEPEATEIKTVAFQSEEQPALMADSSCSIRETLASIWKDALGNETFHSKHNFLEIGGDSLLATQVLFSIRKLFKIEISLNDFLSDPTIDALAGLIENRRESNPTPLSEFPQIIREEDKQFEPFALTEVQKAYYFGRTSDLGLGDISTLLYFELHFSDLDRERLNRALNDTIRYQDMLRVVMMKDGNQKILENTPDYEIKFHDLREFSPSERSNYINSVRKEMSAQIIDCYRWPLFDIRASTIDQYTTRLHLAIDMLIMDASSIQLFLINLALFYNGREDHLRNLTVSFRDYVNALKAFEQTALYETSKTYWLGRVATLPPAPKLPLVKDPQLVTKPKFKRWRFNLPASTWEKLRNRARDYSLTPTVMMLSAFAEILTLWTRHSRFTLNLTLFNRLPLHPDINFIIGDFTDLNLFEVDNSKAEPFIKRALQKQVQLWQDMDHRYFSIGKITRELINRFNDPSKAIMPVVFTSLIGQENENLDAVRESFPFTSDWEDNDLFSITQTPQVWLDHQIIEQQDRVALIWDAVDELFPSGMIDEMFETYKAFLQKLAEDDTTWSSNFPLQSESHQLPYQLRLEQVFEKHNATRTLSGKSLFKDISDQAASNPDRTAVITSNFSVTYGQLETCSNEVAKLLDDYGVQPDHLIAVLAEKGWEQIAAVLGILKAGAAYLPIDATLPDTRIKELLKTGNVRTIVTTEGIKVSEQWGSNLNLVVIKKSMCFGDNSYCPNHQFDTRQLAYVIFTSGSTGKPKGVAISHESALNTIEDINERFAVNSEDRVFGISSLSFDLSVYDVFGPLTVGAALVLPDSDKLNDPSHWHDMISRHHVTLWNSVPALMKMYLEYIGSDWKHGFRLVLISGDWIPLDLGAQIRRNSDQAVSVIGLGGATEASIWSIFYPIEHIDPQWKSIPYGFSLSNQQVGIVNERFEICPIGVEGEIVIGGTGIAAGYWMDPDKTSERFVTCSRTGSRFYKTGDWGKYLADGSIEFLGREDLQVKVGGLRIELGEIESAFKQLPVVDNVVVSVEGEQFGEKQLTAHVVINKRKASGYDLSEDEIFITDPVERYNFRRSKQSIRQEAAGKSIGFTNQNDDATYLKIRTFRKYSEEMIPFDRFDKFISHLASTDLEGIPIPKYLYGSAGGLYPVQMFFYIKPGRIENIEGGLYYYNPVENGLLAINSGITLDSSFHVLENRFIYESSAFSIFFFAKLNAIAPLYGTQSGKIFSYMEAGSISQLLTMKAADYNLGLCQIGMLDVEAIRSLFQLEEDHIYLHNIVGGNLEAHQLELEGFAEDLATYQETLSLKAGQENSYEELIAKLKSGIANTLPQKLIPKTIHLLDALPLTANGKIDRKAVATLKTKNSNQRRQPGVLKSETESRLASIMEQEFNIQNMSRHDNFFDIGGNSLNIIKVHKAIQATFQITFPVMDLFKHPSIASFATNLAGDWNSNELEAEKSKSRASSRLRARKKRKTAE